MRKPNAKERILDVAGELFFKRGYSEVGVNEIIEKAETAKASFYQHFKSKECLCEAWLQEMHALSEQRRTELLASQASASEKVSTYFDQLRDFLIESEFRGCPYSNTGTIPAEEESGILRSIRLHKQSMREFFRKVCEERFADPETAATIGDRLFLLYSGATVEAQNLRSLWPIATAKEAALDLVA